MSESEVSPTKTFQNAFRSHISEWILSQSGQCAERFEGGADPEPLTHVVVKNTQTGKIASINVAAAFVAIGHDPATSVFKGKLAMDADGYVVD